MNNREIELIHYQDEFLMSESKMTLLLGGIGSGKTAVGAFFVIMMVSQFPKSKGLIVANTFTQLMNATVSTLTGILDMLGIPYKAVLSGARKRITIMGCTCYLYSLERPENIRGIEVGWIWGDEIAFATKMALDIIKGRLRGKFGPLYERYTSSPNGFNFIYDIFENMDNENKTDKVHLIRARTKDNVFLPIGYYESLLEDYGGIDNPLAQQELFGQFVNLLAGQIYWGFNRGINVSPIHLTPNKHFPMYACQDFNIDNMMGCYIQYIGGIFYVYQENILEHHNANTDDASRKIKQDLGLFEHYVIPDSTGKARKTSASSQSDFDIMRSYGLIVLETRNPLIRDRQNTLNMHFKRRRVIIDPRCKRLIKEIETLSSRDKEGDSAHVSVALGYGTHYLAPLTVSKRSTYSGGTGQWQQRNSSRRY